MQTEQPMVTRTNIPLMTAADVAKKRIRRFKHDLPDQVIANALNVWIRFEGWRNDIELEALAGLGMSEGNFANVVYRWGYEKHLLTKEQWSPGWGRKQKVKEKPDTSRQWNDAALTQRFKALDDRINAAVQLPPAELTIQVNQVLKDIRRIDSTNKMLGDVLQDIRRTATPAMALSDEVTRLAGIVDLERVGSTSLLERVIKIENKLRGGGRKGPSHLTKLHREIRRRLKVLLTGGK